MSEEREIVIRQQEKFEFYLVALVFTLLALSIQTSTFASPIFSQFFELAGWFCLLLSGLSGLSYLEWLPAIRMHEVKKEELQVTADKLKHKKEQGVEKVHVLQDENIVPIDTRITEYEEVIGKLKEKDSTLDRKSIVKYFIFKWFFVGGVIFVILSRAHEPVTNIINYICN